MHRVADPIDKEAAMPETTPDRGDALQQTISGPIGWVALVVIALSLGGLAVSFLAKQWRRDEEIAKLPDGLDK